MIDSSVRFNLGTYPREPAAAIRLRWLLRRYEDCCAVSAESEQFSCPAAERSGFVRRVAGILARVVGAAGPRELCISDSPIDCLLVAGADLLCRVQEESRAGTRTRVFSVSVDADPGTAAAARAALEGELPVFRSATIKWWYETKDGPTYARMVMDEPLPVEPLMYPLPQLGGDPLAYLRRYLESSATVLFMLGPPGTGKTSLLRRLIYEEALGTAVTYDEEVMRNDAMFIDFLDDEYASLMVLEDVTELLQDRGTGRNDLMARFLNVSDGLIQFPRKKIVFTTNMHALDRVDPALLRPGRCFGVLELRELTAAEAARACASAGLPAPAPGREYPMSELYNRAYEAPSVPGVGVLPPRRAGVA